MLNLLSELYIRASNPPTGLNLTTRVLLRKTPTPNQVHVMIGADCIGVMIWCQCKKKHYDIFSAPDDEILFHESGFSSEYDACHRLLMIELGRTFTSPVDMREEWEIPTA